MIIMVMITIMMMAYLVWCQSHQSDFDFHDDFITMDMMDNKNVLTPKDNPRSLQCPSTLASPFGSFLFEPVHVHCLSMMNRHS